MNSSACSGITITLLTWAYIFSGSIIRGRVFSHRLPHVFCSSLSVGEKKGTLSGSTLEMGKSTKILMR